MLADSASEEGSQLGFVAPALAGVQLNQSTGPRLRGDDESASLMHIFLMRHVRVIAVHQDRKLQAVPDAQPLEDG